MAIEKEIKLALPAGQADAARRFFETLTGEPGHTITLANVYYDTPDLALARSKSAVRVRRTPDGWLQTFKTVGSAEGGLHRRHEWELPVAGDALEIDALVAACDVPEAAAALNDAAGALYALFRTDFSRTLWRIAIGGATVEAAVDLGEIVVQAEHETRREPISEIELELIDGPETALATLAAELQQALPGLVPENISKAQRGYRLRAQ
ncbi:adenylate cyclase [Burkholderia sp. MSMB1459WGS]|uniref:CYTH domain-containing protein n=1 Tax=unclassified Burkholderia TaxID=2613784 RepID=UPI000758FE3A|nr:MULTISPECIES: CYTH domain-containing protein [unclassified Burkholderia]KVD49033.1 adenylate cyclase [Burkholderia sp. ABCPW 11]KVT16991.1 adenylate cyclase [Burkholderia sp. MSMB1078WGS]KWO45391.1 adenylate cyclase [Burkholderia sp. MSMB1459WGS]